MILPHSIDAERQVLSLAMMSIDAVGEVVDIVVPDDFYSSQNRAIWDAIVSLYQRQAPSDPVAVVEELRRSGTLDIAGGQLNIADIAAEGGSIGSASHHARTVADLALVRRLAHAGSEIQSLAGSDSDPGEIADKAESLIYEARGRRERDSGVSLTDSLSSTLEEVERIAEGSSHYLGLPTGFRNIDALLGGLYPDNLVILAARPGIGKSALAVNVARNVAGQGKHVALFSLEMSHSEVSSRMLCAESGVGLTNLRQGRTSSDDWARMAVASERLAALPLTIFDSGHLNLLLLRAQARRLAHRGLGLLIVDYLQLMSHHRRVDSRQQEVAEITRGLKTLAKELHIPILALSQLNRALEARADKRPHLADLRESGAIEQDADVVMFLHRDAAEVDAPVELIVAKHRNGPTDTVRLRWNGAVTRFAD